MASEKSTSTYLAPVAKSQPCILFTRKAMFVDGVSSTPFSVSQSKAGAAFFT